MTQTRHTLSIVWVMSEPPSLQSSCPPRLSTAHTQVLGLTQLPRPHTCKHVLGQGQLILSVQISKGLPLSGGSIRILGLQVQVSITSVM